jgi:hypothetical protein
VGDRSIKRRGFLEIGNQLGQRLGIHNCTGKLVRADLTALLEDVNVFGRQRELRAGSVVLLDQICQMQRARKPCRTCSDDENIRFKSFALDGHRAILAEQSDGT